MTTKPIITTQQGILSKNVTDPLEAHLLAKGDHRSAALLGSTTKQLAFLRDRVSRNAVDATRSIRAPLEEAIKSAVSAAVGAADGLVRAVDGDRDFVQWIATLNTRYAKETKKGADPCAMAVVVHILRVHSFMPHLFETRPIGSMTEAAVASALLAKPDSLLDISRWDKLFSRLDIPRTNDVRGSNSGSDSEEDEEDRAELFMFQEHYGTIVRGIAHHLSYAILVAKLLPREHGVRKSLSAESLAGNLRILKDMYHDVALHRVFFSEAAIGPAVQGFLDLYLAPQAGRAMDLVVIGRDHEKKGKMDTLDALGLVSLKMAPPQTTKNEKEKKNLEKEKKALAALVAQARYYKQEVLGPMKRLRHGPGYAAALEKVAECFNLGHYDTVETERVLLCFLLHLHCKLSRTDHYGTIRPDAAAHPAVTEIHGAVYDDADHETKWTLPWALGSVVPFVKDPEYHVLYGETADSIEAQSVAVYVAQILAETKYQDARLGLGSLATEMAEAWIADYYHGDHPDEAFIMGPMLARMAHACSAVYQFLKTHSSTVFRQHPVEMAPAVMLYTLLHSICENYVDKRREPAVYRELRAAMLRDDRSQRPVKTFVDQIILARVGGARILREAQTFVSRTTWSQ
jgi:hypothetical protein